MLTCEVRTSWTSSEVAANFEQCCCERWVKLLQTLSEVAVNIEQSWSVLWAKLYRPCVAKELHRFRTGAYVTLEVKKIQSIVWRIYDVKVQRVQMTEDCFPLTWWDQGPNNCQDSSKGEPPSNKTGYSEIPQEVHWVWNYWQKGGLR